MSLINMKKVLLISTYDRLAADLNKALNESNYDSSLITTSFVEDDASSIFNLSRFNNRTTWFLNAVRSFIFRKLIFKTKNNSYFQDISESSSYFSFNRFVRIAPFIPDYIIILFDYRAITYRTLFELEKWSNAKIIWLMVDMKPFTGGCSYSQGCEFYKIDCKNCPAIENSFFRDFSNKQLEFKINTLKNINISYVAGSEYQYKQAKNSRLLSNKNIYKFNFPVNTNIFRYLEKNKAKDMLNISTNKIVIMFGSTKVDEPRKGFKYIIDSVKKISQYNKDVFLLIVGNNNKELFDEINIDKMNLGFVNLEKLAQAYQAADLFLCPTTEDSGPTMVTQSLMCGTPVVAFEMGVSLDLIKHKKNGYLSKLYDGEDFLKGIKYMLDYIPGNSSNIIDECLRPVSNLDFNRFVNKIMNLN